MQLFDALVRPVLHYGAEIWGWEEWKKLKRIQDCYIKCTLHLDRSTPEYALLHETKK